MKRNRKSLDIYEWVLFASVAVLLAMQVGFLIYT